MESAEAEAAEGAEAETAEGAETDLTQRCAEGQRGAEFVDIDVAPL